MNKEMISLIVIGYLISYWANNSFDNIGFFFFKVRYSESLIYESVL